MKKILFNDQFGLTEAVLEGRKTMTRRIVPNGTPLGNWEETENTLRYKTGDVVAVAQRYRDCVNDILVNWGQKTDIAVMAFKELPGWANKMFVRADLMPHQIRITDIHIERLQDISDEDCLREGIIEGDAEPKLYGFKNGKHYDSFFSPREAFAVLIDKVSGKGTWDSNPFVFVYEFEIIK